MSDRQRATLRKKQNELIKLAQAVGYTDDTCLDEGAPTIGQMRQCIYPEWESTIERTIASLKSRG